MVQLPAKIKETIDKYLQVLGQNNIPIKEAILFGLCNAELSRVE